VLLELAEPAHSQQYAVGREHVDELGAVDQLEVGLALGRLNGVVREVRGGDEQRLGEVLVTPASMLWSRWRFSSR